MEKENTKNRFLETFWHIIMFSKVISLLKLRTSVTKILPHLQDTWFIEVSFQSRLKKTIAYFILKKPSYEQTSHKDVSLARLYNTTAFHTLRCPHNLFFKRSLQRKHFEECLLRKCMKSNVQNSCQKLQVESTL